MLVAILPLLPLAWRRGRPARNAVAVVAPEVDTAKASSICRASVRRRQVARLRLSRVPGDLLALSKAKHFGALVAAACK